MNATQTGEELETTILITETVQEILRIIQIHFNIHPDEKSLDFQRLLTHVRFIVHRILQNDLIDSDDTTLFDEVRALYPRCYTCVSKINDYFHMKFRIDLTKEEMMYLMLHIGRVVSRSKKEV